MVSLSLGRVLDPVCKMLTGNCNWVRHTDDLYSATGVKYYYAKLELLSGTFADITIRLKIICEVLLMHRYPRHLCRGGGLAWALYHQSDPKGKYKSANMVRLILYREKDLQCSFRPLYISLRTLQTHNQFYTEDLYDGSKVNDFGNRCRATATARDTRSCHALGTFPVCCRPVQFLDRYLGAPASASAERCGPECYDAVVPPIRPAEFRVMATVPGVYIFN